MAADRDIASWIQRQLDRREWRAADLARRMNVTPGTISEWLSRKRVPNPKSCLALADVFDSDPDYVLTLAGHRPATPSSDPWREVKALLDRAEPKPDRIGGLESLIQGWIRLDRDATTDSSS